MHFQGNHHVYTTSAAWSCLEFRLLSALVVLIFSQHLLKFFTVLNYNPLTDMTLCEGDKDNKEPQLREAWRSLLLSVMLQRYRTNIMMNAKKKIMHLFAIVHFPAVPLITSLHLSSLGFSMHLQAALRCSYSWEHLKFVGVKKVQGSETKSRSKVKMKFSHKCLRGFSFTQVINPKSGNFRYSHK